MGDDAAPNPSVPRAPVLLPPRAEGFNAYREIQQSVSDKVGADHFTGVFSYAGMPIEDAEKSLRLFASDVMPELKKLNGVKAEAA